uniref:Polymer-forming cytoskeletal protein n=1 Tax=Thermorudis peleae TaxID=1382356 RepID=A0A831TEN2_9BACT
MIFRRENRGESFHRQLSSLRQQLEESEPESTAPVPVEENTETSFSLDLPSESPFAPARTASSRTTPSEPELPSSRTGRVPASADSYVTILSAHAHWEGTLRSEGSVTIQGRLEGQVHATEDVTIDEGAEVQAEIFAQNVLIHGTVRGRVEAHGRLEIFPTGKVIGNVKAPSLVVHEGAKLSGQLRMERGSEPVRPGATTQ